jgi:hypothetical protein
LRRYRNTGQSNGKATEPISHAEIDAADENVDCLGQSRASISECIARTAIVEVHGNLSCNELIDEAVETRNHEGWHNVPPERSSIEPGVFSEFCTYASGGRTI